MSGLKIRGGGDDKDHKGKGREVIGGPFDILLSTAILPVDNPALLFIHPLPNEPPASSSPPPPAATTTTTSTRTTPSRRPASSPSRSPSKPPPPPTPTPLPPWPSQLQSLCRSSTTAIHTAPLFSEIPSHLPQGDLYLSPGSESAIFGALGAVCEGVDRIVEGAKAGVSGYDPHQQHGIDRVIIIDVDLHHGNGTQEIAWRINATANVAALKRDQPPRPRSSSPRKGGSSPSKAPKKPIERDLTIMYASLHDVFSYPCEDGDPALVQAASINLNGGHGQYIANVHLDSWTHEAEFHEKLYHRYRDGLLGAASNFCSKTAVDEDESDRTLVILSAGPIRRL
ncbi:hypothetical protein RQP46_005877 [Phenoliferia psychrophenolica]